MKCLKIFLLLIGITLGIVRVSTRNIEFIEYCENAGWNLFNEFNSCGPRYFHALEFIQTIKEYKQQVINSTIFAKDINDFCLTLKSVTTCSFGKIVEPKCRHNPMTERFVNLLRIVARLETDFCSEQILYNIANDSGFYCLDESSVMNCRYTQPIVAKSGFPLDDGNICATMRWYEACSIDFFLDCQHDWQIKKYVEQAWDSLNDEFSCNYLRY